jgi:hypothetical protein
MTSTTIRALDKTTHTRRKRFQRRNYFINKPFQLAFAGNMLLIAALGMLVTALTVSWIFIYILDDQLCTVLLHPGYLLKLGIILVCLAAGILTWTVLRTHAIAGPVYKTRQVLRAAAEGRFPDRPVTFRKSDAFKDLAGDLNRCLDAMRADRKRLRGLEALSQNDPEMP